MIRCLKDAGWAHARIYPHNDTDWIHTAWAEQIELYLKVASITV